MPQISLLIAAQSVEAIVMRVRRHYTPVRAPRFPLCQHRGNFGDERFILFVLGHREICKITHGTEYRNRDKYLDHVPTSVSACEFHPPK